MDMRIINKMTTIPERQLLTQPHTANAATMGQKPHDRFSIGSRIGLSLLFAMVPCVILIGWLSYPNATMVYPECKICKFTAHIFLGGTILSQAIMLPCFTDAFHAIDSVPRIFCSDATVPTVVALKVFILLDCISIPLVAVGVVGYRAPPFKFVG